MFIFSYYNKVIPLSLVLHSFCGKSAMVNIFFHLLEIHRTPWKLASAGANIY